MRHKRRSYQEALVKIVTPESAAWLRLTGRGYLTVEYSRRSLQQYPEPLSLPCCLACLRPCFACTLHTSLLMQTPSDRKTNTHKQTQGTRKERAKKKTTRIHQTPTSAAPNFRERLGLRFRRQLQPRQSPASHTLPHRPAHTRARGRSLSLS